MIYHIFKGIVLKINCKNINIELDLLKHYIILFAIRYLTDDNVDLRFIKSYTDFTNILLSFKQLFLYYWK